MFKGFVYVEEAVLQHPNTLHILEKMGNPCVVPITHYKDVFNQSGSDWRNQKQTQKVILAQRTDHFYYKGSDVTPDFGHKHFYYNTLALNCIYDCDYCYLQGLFSSAHMVLFVNNETFLSHTQQLLQKINEPVYFALSYDTDLLAIEHWFPYAGAWIQFASTQPNLTIEIRTKSVNINAIKHLNPNNQTILAWTLSPQAVIDWHEPKTPSEKSRLKAIKQAIDLGWKVRICIDPILHIPNWKTHYEMLINHMVESLPINQLDSISLGVFRINKNFLKRIQKQRDNNAVLYYPYELKEETLSYSDQQKNEMLKFVQEEIKKHHVQIPIVML